MAPEQPNNKVLLTPQVHTQFSPFDSYMYPTDKLAGKVQQHYSEHSFLDHMLLLRPYALCDSPRLTQFVCTQNLIHGTFAGHRSNSQSPFLSQHSFSPPHKRQLPKKLTNLHPPTKKLHPSKKSKPTTNKK